MEALKDSKVKWIGDVPQNWTEYRLENLVSSHFSGSWGNNELENENDVICMRIADFDYPRIRFQDKPEELLTKRNYSRVEISKKKLRYGDILIEKSGGGEKTPVGRAVIYNSHRKALFANFMDCIRINDKSLPDFIKYYLFASYANGVTNLYFNQTTGIQNLNVSRYLKESKVFLPKLAEQQLIANFLDEKCAEIDKLSEDIQKQIEILEDYKKSVITRAVTKGLNLNADMNDSNISYVGNVPKAWKIHPIYYYFAERKHKNTSNQEQNLLSLSYGRIIRKDIDTNGGLLPASFSTYNIVERGDIIIRPTDLQNDKRSLRTGLVTERGIITSAYIGLRPLDDVNSSYYHYLLHAYDVMKVFYNMGNGVRQGLNYSEFSKLLVLEPPKDEQNEIVKYLDSKCDGINQTINLEKERYEQLQTYKKTIIYEYVTGKKRVKGAL